jgi:hypothetical protein
MLPNIPYIFVNGTGEANIIDAPKVNADFDELANILNGNIEKDNIKSGSAICLKDTALTVSAVWTFSSNPIFNASAIADSYLSSNIPKKDAANTFAAKITASAGIDFSKTQAENIVVHKVASLPSGVSADIGRIVYCTGDNKFYGWNGTDWLELSYVGGYTGGAISRYTSIAEVDDSDSIKLFFKTEGASPTVKFCFKGETYPRRHYLELPYHTHVFSGTAHTHSITDPTHYHPVVIGSHTHGTTQFGLSTHTHSVSGSTDGQNHNHTHNVSGTTGNQSASHVHDMASHTHDGVANGSFATEVPSPANTLSQSVSHTHTFSATSGNQSQDHTHPISLTSDVPSASSAVPSTDLGTKNSNVAATGISINNATAGGSNAYAGINIGSALSSSQKLYGKALVIKIDGTDVTANVLSATGWSAIGDGTGSHAFHTAGTGEMDASAWKSYTAGFHTLEIIEAENGYGCRVMVHIEAS